MGYRFAADWYTFQLYLQVSILLVRPFQMIMAGLKEHWRLQKMCCQNILISNPLFLKLFPIYKSLHYNLWLQVANMMFSYTNLLNTEA